MMRTRNLSGEVGTFPTSPLARLGALPIALCGIALVAWGWGLGSVLEYDRAALSLGELYRLFTGHAVHWSGEHLLWNLVALLALGAMCERIAPARHAIAVAAAAVAIPLALFAFDPSLQRYRGLSGLASAQFALLVVLVLREAARKSDRGPLVLGTAFGVAFAGKVSYEAWTQTGLFVDAAGSGFLVVPLAHVVGASCGALATLSPTRWHIVWRARASCEHVTDARIEDPVANGKTLSCDPPLWEAVQSERALRTGMSAQLPGLQVSRRKGGP